MLVKHTTIVDYFDFNDIESDNVTEVDYGASRLATETSKKRCGPRFDKRYNFVRGGKR